MILRNNEVINATDETYGKDANTILREVMEVSSRPDIIRFLFEKFYELLDSGEWKMAEEIIGQLEKEIGNKRSGNQCVYVCVLSWNRCEVKCHDQDKKAENRKVTLVSSTGWSIL